MSGSSKKVIIAALVGNFLVSITKFTAAFFTQSSAMFSEGIHSLVDTGNQVLLLHGLKRAQLPADAEFPFGHGKEIYFWSFIVAILIFAVGAGISIYEGIIHIITPVEVKDSYINYIVLSIAIVFEGAAWLYAYREFKKENTKFSIIKSVKVGKDPAMFVVLFEDSAALLGLFVAMLGIFLSEYTGILIFDGIASVVIGTILAATAMWLAVETKGLLIGESADPDIVSSIKTLADEFDEVEYINEVLTMHMGPKYILVNLSIDFDDQVMAGKIEQVISDMGKRIKQKHPLVKRVFVEAESRGEAKVKI
ncbi:MAG: cation diffusion facilitator family transporter [Enterobacterales bacterium]|jgi:cation diffusion facilitator family transporter